MSAARGGRRAASRRSTPRRRGRQAAQILALPVLGTVIVAAAAVRGPATLADDGPREIDVVASVASCVLSGGLTASTGQVEPGDLATALTFTGEESAESDLDPTIWTPEAASGDATIIRSEGSEGGVAFTAGQSSAGGGLVVSACSQVADDSWYLGAGTDEAHPSRLVLTNVGDVVGSVDVQLWGPAGPIAAVGATGVVVQPGEVRSIPVSDFVVGVDEVAIQVTRTRGAVTSTLVDSSTAGSATGSEVVSSIAEPSTETVIAGMASAPDRTLLLANPGTEVATVTVRQSGTDADFVPAGLESIQVPAGTVLPMALPEASGTDATAYRVSSDLPVLSAVRVRSSARDFAFASSSEAWTGPVVVPIASGAGQVPPVLQLMAADADANVSIDVFDASMASVGHTEAAVTATSLTSVNLAEVSANASYAVVRSSEPVHGAAVYRVDDLLAIMNLVEAPVQALGPQVTPDF